MPRPHRIFNNSNTPTPIKLPKGKVEKIHFGEQEEEIFRIWKGLSPNKLVEKWKEAGIKGNYIAGTPLARMNRIRVLIGFNGSNLVGRCSKCDDLNTHLVKYKTQGITIIERYCSEHVPLC